MARWPHQRLRRPLALASAALVIGLAPAITAPRALAQPAPPPPLTPTTAVAPIRGVWMTLNDMPTLRDRGRMQAAVRQLADLGFNTLYVVAWNGATAYYPSSVTRNRGLQGFEFRGLQGQEVLAELIAAGQQLGLRVIPWFEFGFMAPPSSDLATKHPQWLSRQRDGSTTSLSAAGEVVWLNPFHPEVQALITELVLELVSLPGADGVQFDDHMSLPSSFGYDPFTVALYRKDTGGLPPADPQDPAWVQWRADRLSAFLVQLRQAIRSANPRAVVSLSPNYADFAYKLQLQDWRTWVARRAVDEVVVQLYRPDLESFMPQLNRPELLQTARQVPTAIGIMSGQRNRPVSLDLIASQVRATRQRGLGVAFFYFETLWQQTPEPPEQRQNALREMLMAPIPPDGS
ncbi:MAG: family 10 glycosylhydrolase [Cyanobacteriota bacterium]|nr:family 10 glycosylhydrolase [Cyanobacteriota bacterium]